MAIHKPDSDTILTRISAIVAGCLLVAFFAVTVNNMALISNQVLEIKNGPYQISVSAGHVETNLARLDTIVNQLVESYGTIGNAGEAVRVCENVDRDILEQLDTINQHSSSAGSIHMLKVHYQMLSNRLQYLTAMYRYGNVADADIARYASEYVSPLIDELLGLSGKILDESTHEVDNLYAVVNAASGQTIFVSTILMAAVAVVIGIYLFTLRRKSAKEAELRQDLEGALAKAEIASSAKSAFLSNMSHDIRTPMNAIVGLTTIASENIDDPIRVQQCLTRITTSSRHLLSLINDALDMNKIESGKASLSEEVFSLDGLMNELASIVQPSASEKHLKTELKTEDIVYDSLIGDTMRVRQIILNLVSNAIKYTNEGDHVKIILSELPQTKPGVSDVQFVVEDSGIGMKKEFLEYIFEPFERERNDFTNFTEGTGLGMAITKNLVQLMSGTIEVESELGVGTRFTVTIPFKIADSVNMALLKEKQSETTDATASTWQDRDKHLHEESAEDAAVKAAKKKLRVKGRVLLVDDNEINMDIAEQLVTSRGAEADCAFDGIEAVSKVADAPDGYYDLIFMDWQMPHMNGIEATKAINEFCHERGRKKIPIVAMTANAFNEDRETALEAGMDGFMAKPINVKELEANLSKYLEEVTDKAH